MTDPARQPLYVTRPWLPPLEELMPMLERMWDTRILTNGGPFHRQLEAALAQQLGLEHVTLVNNATTGLLLALRQLGVGGEVITTPFTFSGTTHVIDWAGATPVFVDVDPKNLNLDPAGIEAAITPRTTAILPVHCYGQPCDVAAIDRIARAHGLKVLYDAAHAFGVTRGGASILSAGDLSVVSFHATKVFNTFEGGMIVSHDAQTYTALERLKDFGIVDEQTVAFSGINGKLNEFSAAVGLVQLRHVDEVIRGRARVAARYRERLAEIPSVRCLIDAPDEGDNHAYFPILVGRGQDGQRDEAWRRLRAHGVHARRYFHPLVSALSCYRHLPSSAPERLPVAHDAANRVLCLPMHPELTDEDVDRIVGALG